MRYRKINAKSTHLYRDSDLLGNQLANHAQESELFSLFSSDKAQTQPDRDTVSETQRGKTTFGVMGERNLLKLSRRAFNAYYDH